MDSKTSIDLREFIKYNGTGAIPYHISQKVNRVKNCNGFLAVNTGGDVVRVNGHVLYPGTNTLLPGGTLGDSHNWGGNRGEVYLGEIQITFLGVGPNPEVTIDQKFYYLDNNVIV